MNSPLQKFLSLEKTELISRVKIFGEQIKYLLLKKKHNALKQANRKNNNFLFAMKNMYVVWISLKLLQNHNFNNFWKLLITHSPTFTKSKFVIAFSTAFFQKYSLFLFSHKAIWNFNYRVIANVTNLIKTIYFTTPPFFFVFFF